MSDSSGFIHDPDGLDQEKLRWVIDLKTKRRGRIQEYAEKFGAAYHAGEKPWGIAADIAMPCATQNEIQPDAAQQLVDNGVKAVVEGANMPTSPEAVEIIRQAGVLFAPGKAANAGGVAVSGFERTQNAQYLSWTRGEVDRRLQEVMKQIHSTCVRYGIEDGSINYVRGANIGGFRKVADAVLALGVV